MNAKDARDIIRESLKKPVRTWGDYSPVDVPLAVFDSESVHYLNHPDPPAARPDTLNAATAQTINGVLTATIPAELWDDPQDIIAVTYHEGFHVYQDSGAFHAASDVNFFRALAFYPEMQAEYRALCQMEAAIHNATDTHAKEKAAELAAIAKARYGILAAQGSDVMRFDRNLERMEGTAAYVEQLARKRLFGTERGEVITGYGWSRQYGIGAATCWLLDDLLDDWHGSVENGRSPSDVLIYRFTNKEIDLERLDYEVRLKEQHTEVDRLRVDLLTQFDEATSEGEIIIQLPETGAVHRAFNPASMRSLSDGRMIHTERLIVHIPQGKISVEGQTVLEDFNTGQIILPALPYSLEGDHLSAKTDIITIDLQPVRRTGGALQKFEILQDAVAGAGGDD